MPPISDLPPEPFQVIAHAYDLASGRILVNDDDDDHDHDHDLAVFWAFSRHGERPRDTLARAVRRTLNLELRVESTPLVRVSLDPQTNIQTYSYVVFADDRTPANLFLRDPYAWHALAGRGRDARVQREFFDELNTQYRAHVRRPPRREHRAADATDDAVAA